MDNAQPIDYRHELYKRFELDEHEIREGGKSKSGKIQWFIYVNREPIQARLDELFFMAWNLDYFDRHVGADYVAVTCAITINGVVRQYSGGQGLNGKKSVDEDTIKGAYTDAFKRAASMWGMGLYLQNAPQIWTEGYENGNWAQKDERETEAWAKFTAWYNGVKYEQPKQQPRQNRATTSPNGNNPPQQPQNANLPPSSAKNGQTNGNGMDKDTARQKAIKMLMAAGVDPNAAIKIEPPPNPPTSSNNLDWATRMIERAKAAS